MLSVRIADAAPGSTLVIGRDEAPVGETIRIDKPLSLVGGEGVTLRGYARDALLRVVSPGVRISGVRFDRTPCPGGAASWGSLVVVEDDGDAAVVDCGFTGAAHGYLVEPNATLDQGEAWTHAGIDVRGTGHVRVERCSVDACVTAVSASVYPADDRPNLVVLGLGVHGGGRGVRTSAAARADLCDVDITGCSEAGLTVDRGTSVTADRLTVRGSPTGLWVSGEAKVTALRVSGGAVAVFADQDGRLDANEVDLDAQTSAVAAHGAATVAVGRGALRGAYTAAEGRGVASLVLDDVEISGATVLAWAWDGSRVELKALRHAGPPPEWGAYADLAAEVVADAPLPGKSGAGGLGRVGGVVTEAWDLPKWIATLGERSACLTDAVRVRITALARSRLREGGAPALAESAALAQLLWQWGERGDWALLDPGAPARPPDARGGASGTPLRIPLPAAPVAVAAAGGRVYVGLKSGAIHAWSNAGEVAWRAKGTLGQVLVAVGDRLLALRANGSQDVLVLLDGATGAVLGTTSAVARVASVRLGPPVELWTYDDRGHPTDRCSYLSRWAAGSSALDTEVQGQGELQGPGRWDWRASDAGAWAGKGMVAIGGGRTVPGVASVRTAGGVAVAAADAVRVYDPDGRVRAAMQQPDVVALAWDGDRLWGATSGRELLCWPLV